MKSTSSTTLFVRFTFFILVIAPSPPTAADTQNWTDMVTDALNLLCRIGRFVEGENEQQSSTINSVIIQDIRLQVIKAGMFTLLTNICQGLGHGRYFYCPWKRSREQLYIFNDAAITIYEQACRQVLNVDISLGRRSSTTEIAAQTDKNQTTTYGSITASSSYSENTLLYLGTMCDKLRLWQEHTDGIPVPAKLMGRVIYGDKFSYNYTDVILDALAQRTRSFCRTLQLKFVGGSNNNNRQFQTGELNTLLMCKYLDYAYSSKNVEGTKAFNEIWKRITFENGPGIGKLAKQLPPCERALDVLEMHLDPSLWKSPKIRH